MPGGQCRHILDLEVGGARQRVQPRTAATIGPQRARSNAVSTVVTANPELLGDLVLKKSLLCES